MADHYVTDLQLMRRLLITQNALGMINNDKQNFETVIGAILIIL